MTPQEHQQAIHKALEAFKSNLGETAPNLAIVLGSGLSEFAEQLENVKSLSYSDIPHYAAPSVTGHSGQCMRGNLNGNDVLVFCGRLHAYEGHPLWKITLGIRVLHAWGTKKLMLTNAAGGINEGLKPGSSMLINNHINLMGVNPLVGCNLDKFGPRFPDLTYPYDQNWIKSAETIAKEEKLSLHKGCYAAVLGPNYETAAEIKMLKTLGADAVGMSTVPETLVARHQGMKVLGLSFISNFGAGLSSNELIDHQEVLKTLEKFKPDYYKLLKQISIGICKETT